MTAPTPTYAGFARIFWMFAGPILLVLMAYQIFQQGAGWRTRADVAYMLTLAALPLCRLLEFRGGDPKTTDGDPATPAHLRRYAAVVVAVGLGLWVVAHLAGSARGG